MTLIDGLKAFAKELNPATSAATDIGDVYISQSMKDQGIFKAYLPRYLYKPPFGYPRTDNVPLIKQLAKNPFIYSIKKTIKEEVANSEWDIVFKKDSEKKEDSKLEETRLRIKKHFQNPNRNKESWADIRLQIVEDLMEVDAGVIVKVFNLKGEYSQMFAKDGGSFLVNPDVYGYMGNRDAFIPPISQPLMNMWGEPSGDQRIKQYGLEYSHRAAYYQYGTIAAASIPIPFGLREVVYMKMNPRSDQPYGVSPIAILADIILTLVYGASYNLDFYMNNNMAEGIMSIIGADDPELKAFRQRMEKEYRVEDKNTGFTRRMGFRVPIVGHEATFTPFQLDPKTMEILPQQSWFYKIALICFGLNAQSMGIAESGGLNTGDGDNQFKYYLRKSARPYMNKIKEHVDKEIIAEFGEEAYDNLEYQWDNYDLEEDLKKHDLYKKQIDMGLKSPKMIAEELGIDYAEVAKYKEEEEAKEMAMQQSRFPDPRNFDGQKSVVAQTAPKNEFEAELQEQFLAQGNKILGALDTLQ